MRWERQRQGIALAEQAGRYRGRKARVHLHDKIITLRSAGHSIAKTVALVECRLSQVKRIWAKRHKTAEELKNSGKIDDKIC